MAASVQLARLQHADAMDPGAVVAAVCRQTSEYVLIGGHAMSILLGRARATVDVDIVVREDAVVAVAEVLKRSYPLLSLVDMAARGRGDNLRLAIPGREHHKDGDRIDIIRACKVFGLALRHRQRVACGSGYLWIPSFEAAIGMTYAAAISPWREPRDRGKDTADFVALVEATATAGLDRAVLREFGRTALAGVGDYEIGLAVDKVVRGATPF